MSLQFRDPVAGSAHRDAVPAQEAWQVLLVDDDPHVLGLTDVVLRNARIEGRPLRVHAARSAVEARARLSQTPDVAVAIIDVVLKGGESGLDLVRHIRSTLGNHSMRIVLHTGRPAIAPERATLTEFDINAYLDKSTTDAGRIYSVMLTSIRSYHEVAQLQSAIGRLELMACTDALTGLRNKSALCTGFSQAVCHARNRFEPLTLMFLDVDGFKRINDDRGHLSGDELLRRIGAAIEANSREGDLCFRYGGDEFIVILPCCSKEQATDRYLVRLNQCFDALGVSLSIGMSDAQPPLYPTIEEMLSRADADMYLAKRARKAAAIVEGGPKTAQSRR